MKYKGFTLIEVLIVMGILLILIAIGIGVGRYAIARADRVYHQDMADKLFEALVKYKLDYGEYPKIGICATCIEEQFFAEALGYKGVNYVLKPYIEDGTFDGGTDASYYYHVDPASAQFVIVCVSLGGVDDENENGHYCTGDGIGTEPAENPLKVKEAGSVESGDVENVNIIRRFDVSDWYLDEGFAVNN
jgi:prepilin-type N-terminal cleavage/methylation domain-containing protein